MKDLIKRYKMEMMTDRQVRTMTKRYLKTMPDSQIKILLYLLLRQINNTKSNEIIITPK